MCAKLWFCLWLGLAVLRSEAGTWSALSNAAPDSIDTMLLLSDGTVMATAGLNGTGRGWFLLTPNPGSGYLGGTWTELASMHDTRLYFSSAVLVNGQVFVAGGEFGSGTNTAEVYDPAGDLWTRVPNATNLAAGGRFLDSISKILPNGDVLVQPAFSLPYGSEARFNFAANAFSTGPVTFPQWEASWLKLPDNSILTIIPFGTGSQRYIPSLDRWLSDSDVPVDLYDALGEMGPAFLLPNGNAFFIGGSGHTAIYTPSGTTNAGAWTAGPDLPDGMGMPDAPGAMMANGKILCAMGPPASFSGPTTFCEYDYASNAFTVVSNPVPINNGPYILRMLDLPDGTVLFSRSDSQLFVYYPDGNPLASGKPAISGVTTNSDGSFRLTGTQLNGISEGACYGDDAQMDSNYPILYVTNGAATYYLKSFNWSSTGVMTGTNIVTTDFTVPTNIPAGTYSMFVSANGISSDTVDFTIAPVDPAPAAITLTNSDVWPASSFSSGLNWSDGQAPAGMNNYVVSARDLCTPSTYVEMNTFRGGSLYLTNGGALRLQNPISGDTTTIGAPPGRALVMDGGIVSDWAGLPETLGGYIVLTNGNNIFDPQTNVLTVGGFVSGPGSLTVDSPNGITGGIVAISRPTAYTGGTILNAADTLRLVATGTLGATNSSVTFSNTLGRGYGTLDINNGFNPILPNLNSAGGFITNSSGMPITITIGNSNVASATGDGSGIFAGSFLAGDQSPICLTKIGAGTLTLSSNSILSSLNIGHTNNGTPMTNGSVSVGSGGRLAVGAGSTGSICVASGSYSGISQGALDLSAAAGFTANVDMVQMGVNSAATGTVDGSVGALALGTNNSITAATSITIGDTVALPMNSATQTVSFAANGNSVIATPNFILGGRRSNAALALGAGARLNLGSASNRTALWIGHGALSGSIGLSDISVSSTADFSPGTLNAALGSLIIGTLNSAGTGSELGAVLIGTNGANHLDIAGPGNVVLIGTNFTSGSSTAAGILTVSNLDAASAITSTDNQTAVLLGADSGATGTLNLYGGTLTFTTTGAAIAGGAGTSTLNLDDMTLIAGTNSDSFITNLSAAYLNSGGVVFDSSGFDVTVAQTLNGPGGLTKTNAGTLRLSGTNGYTGTTRVLAGTLALSGAGTIGGSSTILVSDGAVLDVSGRSDQTLTLNSNQTFQGRGFVLGKLNASPGSNINRGNSIGALTVSSNVDLAGTLMMKLNRTNLPVCDQLVSSNSTVTGGGTLSVTNLGAALQTGDQFQLFNTGVAGFATVILPPLSSGLIWTNRLAVDGSIQVIADVPTSPPELTMQLSGSNIAVSWPADHVGWRLQNQTNSLLGTNWTDIAGTSLTNLYQFVVDPANDSLYFRMVYP